jgi:hypothetical protein
MLYYFSTATSRGSPAAGRADLVLCSVKIVALAFFFLSVFFLYLTVDDSYLVKY